MAPVVLLTLVVPWLGALITVTLAAFKLLSLSLSLAKTFTVVLVSSSVVALSLLATGASFTAVMVMLTVAVFDVMPSISCTL